MRVGGVNSSALATTSDYTNSWHLYALRNASGSAQLYIDGVAVGSAVASGASTLTTSWNYGKNGASSAYDKTVFDEVRLSDTARSADWILAEYNNQSNPSTFYSIAP